jgi:hypothetical protein
MKVIDINSMNRKTVLFEQDFFLFKSKVSPTLKYINDVIDHIVEVGIYMQFM